MILMEKPKFKFFLFLFVLQIIILQLNGQIIPGKSPFSEPYPYLNNGSFSGKEVPESPDPLVSYRWSDTKATDSLQIYLLKPTAVFADKRTSFENLQSLTGNNPGVIVKGTGSIRIDKIPGDIITLSGISFDPVIHP